MTRKAMPSIRFLLSLLIVAGLLTGAPLAVPVAQASSLAPLLEVGSAVASKRKKKPKKKAKKKKKEKEKKAEPAPPPTPATSVAILAFEGDGGGQAMAGQVQGGITSMGAADSYQMDIALAPGTGRFEPPSVKAALAATGANALVRGMGLRQVDGVDVKVFAFSPDGVLRYAKLYHTPVGDSDPLVLAPTIAKDLDAVLPKLASLPPVSGADAKPLQTAAAPAPLVTTPPPGTTPPPAQPEPAQADETPRATPLFSVGLAFDTLYWSYDLQSDQLVSTVNWHPLDPYFGGSLTLALWPIEWVGVDAAVHAGLRGYPGAPLVDQAEISITALSAELNLRARYVFGFGVGLGGHLGYRYDGSLVSEQTPVVVAPGTSAHLISPGLDLYVTALAPLLSARLSADVVPWGLYGESPDQPGASAGLWGWRVDGALRSTFFMGIFAELRAFYGNSYVSYTGAGTRTNYDNVAIAGGQVITGLRGLSLGLGWSL